MDYLHPSITDILLISLIGFLTVFVVLVFLMLIIVLISKVSKMLDKPAKKKETAPIADVSAPDTADTYTGVKLNGVPDKTAAILMAIVADKLDKPLDNLRFISIKEVK